MSYTLTGNLSGAFGCVFNMWSSEYFGRKRSLTIGSAICIVGASFMTGSNGLPMFVVGRLIMVARYACLSFTDFVANACCREWESVCARLLLDSNLTTS